MKIKFLATGDAPSSYSFNGDVVTATYNGQSESIDFSVFGNGDEFTGLELDVLPIIYTMVISNVERVNGELRLTLCQKAGKGHWVESDWIDAIYYDANTTYITEV